MLRRFGAAALLLAWTAPAAAQIVVAPSCAGADLAGGPDSGYECVTTPSGAPVRIYRGGESRPVAEPARTAALATRERGVRVGRLPAPERPPEIEDRLPAPNTVTLDPACIGRVKPLGGGTLSTRYAVCIGDLLRRGVPDPIEMVARIEQAAGLACRRPQPVGLLAAVPAGPPRRRACRVQAFEDAVFGSEIGLLKRFVRQDLDPRLLARLQVPREGIFISRDTRLGLGDADRF